MLRRSFFAVIRFLPIRSFARLLARYCTGDTHDTAGLDPIERERREIDRRRERFADRRNRILNAKERIIGVRSPSPSASSSPSHAI
jgi:hypothetical protein